jgi:hypothetical protein
VAKQSKDLAVVHSQVDALNSLFRSEVFLQTSDFDAFFRLFLTFEDFGNGFEVASIVVA